MTQNLQTMIGRRIEIPVHYDMWARGARFGEITSFRRGKPGQSDYVTVKLDHAQVKRRVKLWRIDWKYARVQSDRETIKMDQPLR